MPQLTSFKIENVENIKCTNVRDFKLPILTKKKEELNIAKSLYDKPYNEDTQNFTSIIRLFEHSTNFKKQFSIKYNTPHVTNAWLKAYEMLIHYNMIPTKPTDKFVYFDNAAFPGTFILTTWHIVSGLNIKNFEWYGSSLITSNGLTNGPLEDYYGIYKKYPNNWLMDENNNGDVTDYENQLDFEKNLGGKVDLYTSDLGFDVSDDFNKQEELHAIANMGQILTGLLTLKKGGNMITKQYTSFEPFTISLIALLTTVFNRVEICKPMFSKPSNSETYIIGLDYKGKDDKVIPLLMERLKNWSLKPLTTKKCLSNEFISSIVNAQTYFTDIQIKMLKDIISEYKRFSKMGKIDKKYILNNNIFKKRNNEDIKKWEDTFPAKTLSKHL